MSRLVGLTVNGSTLITGDLEVNGTIDGYATQAAIHLKANATDVFTKSQTDDKLNLKANTTASDNKVSGYTIRIYYSMQSILISYALRVQKHTRPLTSKSTQI